MLTVRAKMPSVATFLPSPSRCHFITSLQKKRFPLALGRTAQCLFAQASNIVPSASYVKLQRSSILLFDNLLHFDANKHKSLDSSDRYGIAYRLCQSGQASLRS